MRHLLRNSCRTPDGTELISRSSHDYVTHKDANGEVYMRDGGLSYIRCNVNKEPAVETSVYSDDSHKKIREGFEWGTYGKGGKSPLKYKKLKDMSVNHIKAILLIQELSTSCRKVFQDELKGRKDGH